MTPRFAKGHKTDRRVVRERQNLYRDVNVFILCHSVFRKRDLNEIDSFWIPEIQATCPDTPFIIVGTKSDFRPGFPGYVAGSLRAYLHLRFGELPDFVGVDSAKNFAKAIGASDCLECAATAGDSGATGVNAVFTSAIRVAQTPLKSSSRLCECSIM